MLKLQSNGDVHLRMRAFTHMFIAFAVAFNDPATAIILTVSCTAFVSRT